MSASSGKLKFCLDSVICLEEKIESLKSDLEWRDINTAPKDGTEVVGWFETNEVRAPHKSKPWITRWKIKQWKDAAGKKVGKPFGLWITEGWRDPMSYAPTKWMPLPPNKIQG